MAPKKSSKASSPSWRTLRRQADQAPTSAQAAALVKEANRLRRAKRAKTKAAAKAGPKKRTRKIKAAAQEYTNKAKDALNQTLFGNAAAPAAQTQGWSPAPTNEQMIVRNRAEEIATLARSKGGGYEEIVRRFECWNRIAELNGRKEGEESNAAVVANLIKQQNINVVAGFLATINGAAAANRGPLPRSMVISGYVLARVVDALTQAGYTEDGFKSDGIRRPDRNQVVEDMIGNRLNRPR